jgi:uncharacterized membrane protein
MAPDLRRSYVNIHGRKPTRGLRPWLLIPKVLAVGAALGLQLATILATTAARDFAQAGRPDAATTYLFLVKRLFGRCTEPAIAAAAVLGILLFAQHPAVFVRQRWWQTKMAALVGSGGLSLWLSPRLAELTPAATPAAWEQALVGQCALIGLTICVIVLGRLKPRLGQGAPRFQETAA